MLTEKMEIKNVIYKLAVKKILKTPSIPLFWKWYSDLRYHINRKSKSEERIAGNNMG